MEFYQDSLDWELKERRNRQRKSRKESKTVDTLS